jgi:hypothetical protein
LRRESHASQALPTRSASHRSCGLPPRSTVRQGGWLFRPTAMVLPPYVYGAFPGEPENTAAFWCEKRRAATTTYLLVIFHRSGRPPVECSLTLAWSNPPRGLSISKEQHVPLSEFRLVSGGPLRAPPGAVTDYPPIRDYYDGVETLFYLPSRSVGESNAALRSGADTQAEALPCGYDVATTRRQGLPVRASASPLD